MAFDFAKFRKLNVNRTVNFALHLIDQFTAAAKKAKAKFKNDKRDT